MTTIAIVKNKDSVTICADTQTTANYHKEVGVFTKIFTISKIANPITFAWAWDVKELQWMKIFLEKYFQPIQNSNEIKVLATEDDVIFMMWEYITYVRKMFQPSFDESENNFVFIQWQKVFLWDGDVVEVKKYTALGSWFQYAMWYMSAKLDAVWAVRCSCKHDLFSHEPIKTIKIKMSKLKVK